MVNDMAISTTAFILTEVSILQTKIFGLQIMQSLFLKDTICYMLRNWRKQKFSQWHGWQRINNWKMRIWVVFYCSSLINRFQGNIPFLYPLKTSENLWFLGRIKIEH